MGKYEQFLITLPAKLVRAKGWDKGQQLEITFNKRGNLEIVEK